MTKRRFTAPPREAVPADNFRHPLYAGYAAFSPWMTERDWPDAAELTRCLQQTPATHAHRFVEQTRALLDDGLHYEQRIATQRIIATRPHNWHDLFNAMVWCTHPAIKLALNARQIADIARMGTQQRSRAQYALTHFDEAGVIVRVADAALLAAWDRHDWLSLFHHHGDAWQSGRIGIVAVIGHALLEHGLRPELFAIGKCLVVQGDAAAEPCVQAVADAIADGDVLNDPLELRPLPLAGIPGWYPGNADAAFLDAECFRPLRAGRGYPAPIMAL